MKPVSLSIEGMMCEGCVRRVEKLLARQEGALVDEVGIGWAKLRLGAETGALEKVLETLTAAGYKTQVQG